METKIIKICKKWKCAVEVLSNMDRVCNSWGQINRLHSDWLAQYCVQQSYIFAIYLFAIYKLSLKLFYISYFIRRDSLEYPAQYWHQLISYFSNIYEIVKLFCNIFAIFRSFWNMKGMIKTFLILIIIIPDDLSSVHVTRQEVSN